MQMAAWPSGRAAIGAGENIPHQPTASCRNRWAEAHPTLPDQAISCGGLQVVGWALAHRGTAGRSPALRDEPRRTPNSKQWRRKGIPFSSTAPCRNRWAKAHPTVLGSGSRSGRVGRAALRFSPPLAGSLLCGKSLAGAFCVRAWGICRGWSGCRSRPDRGVCSGSPVGWASPGSAAFPG